MSMRYRTRVSLSLGLSLIGVSGCIPDVVPSSGLPSCDGLPTTCGPKGDESCCASLLVTGGTYDRLDDNMQPHPATVSDFLLDRFEVTVGRFQRFVEDYPENKPDEGDGERLNLDDSGWSAAWELPADQDQLKSAIQCGPTATWSEATDGEATTRPMNCVNWFVAFAFCAWDGGFLPTEAEWNYAAAGGDEPRPYAWGDAPPDPAHATYCTDYSEAAQGCPSAASAAAIPKAGSRSPKGDGQWGQADLSGSMREWTLDWHAQYPDPCKDCANLAAGSVAREARGGDWNNPASQLGTSVRIGYRPSEFNSWIGLRCARSAR